MRLLVLSALFFSFSAIALDRGACSQLLNNGLYKTYKYAGVDYPLTKATKTHGSTQGSSTASTENTTAILDPKYTSNVLTSELQSTSSTGDCSLIGYQQLKEDRNKFYQQNEEYILKQIAQQDGEFLDTLAVFNLCTKKSHTRFKEKLQSNLQQIMQSGPNQIDHIIKDDKLLQQECLAII